MTRGEEFQELRPLLFAIAYRILGSVAEAEDAVQETWRHRSRSWQTQAPCLPHPGTDTAHAIRQFSASALGSVHRIVSRRVPHLT